MFFFGGGTSSRATLSPLPGSGAHRSERKGTGAGHLLGSAQHIHVPKSSPGESRWPRAPMLPVVAESPFALGIRRLKRDQDGGAAMRRGEVSGNICTASPCPGAAGGARWVPVTRCGWVLAQFRGGFAPSPAGAAAWSCPAVGCRRLSPGLQKLSGIRSKLRFCSFPSSETRGRWRR